MAESSWQKKKVTNILQSLAAAYLANRQYENAVEKFLQLKALGDDEPSTCLGLAGAFLGLKQTTPEALDAYRRFCELFPEDGELISNIAELLLAFRVRTDDALHIYRCALAFHPPFERELHLVVLEALEARGDLSLALQAARSAALLPGSEAPAVRKLVSLSWRQRRFDELLQELTMLSEQPALTEEVRQYLAMTLAYRAFTNDTALTSKELRVVRNAISYLPPAMTLAQARDQCLLKLAVARSERPLRHFNEPAAAENLQAGHSGRSFKHDREKMAPAGDAPRFSDLFTGADDEDEGRRLDTGDEGTAGAAEYSANHRTTAVMVAAARTPLPFSNESSPPDDEFVRSMFDDMRARTRRLRRFTDGLIVVADTPDELLEMAATFLRKRSRDDLTPAPQSSQPVVLIHSSSDETMDESLRTLTMLDKALHLISHLSPFQGGERETPRRVPKLLITADSFPLRDDRRALVVTNRRHVQAGIAGSTFEVGEIVWQDPFEQRLEGRPLQVGRFSVERRICSTDIFSTFIVRDNTLGVAAILKSLAPQRAVDFDEAELMQAIRRVGRLTHPGLALVHDMGKHEGVFYFVREYVEGHSLAEQRSFTFVPSVAKILSAGMQACRALHAAHREGVLHLNLRPGNFWITPEGKVRLTDFSLPGLYDTAYSTDHERNYIAPELRESASSSPASDVYSLAALLFLMISHLPSTAAEDDFFAPLDFSQDQQVPEALKEILFAAAAHDPLGRPQSMFDFERQLRQCQSSLPPSFT
jgi:tetratricopeptide (TPR) repeat protein